MDLSYLDKLSEKEREYALSILKEFSETGHSEKYDNLIYSDFNEIPVDIETFVDDYNYLGNAWHDGEGKTKLFPYWRKELRKLFPDNLSTNVNNVILSGSRGRGKTEISVLIASYLLHRLLCMKDPIAFYHLKPTETITFAFMNIKLALAEEIGVSKFQNTIQSSPWFMSHGTISGTKKKIWTPQQVNGRDIINIKIGSQPDDLIGLALQFCFFDEISFIRNQDIDVQKQKASDAVDTAIGGMKTRFIHNGKSSAMLVLASSKRSEKSFLEEHMKKKLESEKENVYISDGSVWEVWPKGKFSEEKFYVALGNKFLQSQIIPEEDNQLDWIEKGYKILEVPVDFKPDFIDDIDRALCDFAGISSSEMSKYISGAAVKSVKNINLKNPFTKDIIEVGNAKDDKSQYYDYFDLSRVPRNLLKKPLYIHLDMSVSGDMTGIAGVWINGKKHSADELSQANDLFYTLAFGVSIKAPKGRQISFEKNKNFIYWLRENGFNIKGVSTDSFQSVETGQVLSSKGYNYTQISVDRVDQQSHICKPYQYFKSTIYENRIEIFESPSLEEELVNLERNINTGKVDHPNGGRKDLSDAVCGALYNASQHAEEFGYEFGENMNAMLDVSNSGSGYEQYTVDFEEALKEALTKQPQQKKQQDQELKKDSQYLDFGFGKAKTYSGYSSDGIVIW